MADRIMTRMIEMVLAGIIFGAVAAYLGTPSQVETERAIASIVLSNQALVAVH